MKAQLELALLLVLSSGAAGGGGVTQGAAPVVDTPRGFRAPLLGGASLRRGASGAGLRGGEDSAAEYSDPPVTGVFAHDFGTGDYGDEKWRRANAKLDNLGAGIVTRGQGLRGLFFTGPLLPSVYAPGLDAVLSVNRPQSVGIHSPGPRSPSAPKS